MQTSSTQGQTINNKPNNQEHTGITKKTPINRHVDKPIKTLTLRHGMVESAENRIGFIPLIYM